MSIKLWLCLVASVAMIALGSGSALALDANSLDFNKTNGTWGAPDFTVLPGPRGDKAGDSYLGANHPTWTTQTPDACDAAYVRNGGTCTVTGANGVNATAYSVTVGGERVGLIEGQIPGSYDFPVLYEPASYLVIASDANLTLGYKLKVATRYDGTVTQNGGNVTLGSGGILTVGEGANSDYYDSVPDGNTFYAAKGTYNLGDGKLVSQGLILGEKGATGILNQSGGSYDSNGKGPAIGKNGGNGAYNMSGGVAVIRSSDTPYVGQAGAGLEGIFNGNGTGLINVTGGSMVFVPKTTNVNNYINFGSVYNTNSDGNGALKISGGTFKHDASSAVGVQLFSIIVGDTNIYDEPAHTGIAKGLIEVTNTGTLLTSHRITLGWGKYASQATLKVGKDATVKIGGLDSGSTNAASTVNVGVEIGSATNYSKIDLNGASLALGGTQASRTLDIQMLSSTYVPYANKEFAIITNFAGSTSSGNFTAFTSNMSINAANYAFADANGNIDSNVTALAWTGGISWPGGSGSIANYVAKTNIYARKGDANRDGLVSTGDLSLLAGSWGLSGKTWANGDFNGDGVVGTGDLSLLAGNWGWNGQSAAPAPDMQVPEPATMSLLALGGLALIRRRSSK